MPHGLVFPVSFTSRSLRKYKAFDPLSSVSLVGSRADSYMSATKSFDALPQTGEKLLNRSVVA